jgi:FKBP-type peptidyl-prolyl cis-trans isomerase
MKKGNIWTLLLGLGIAVASCNQATQQSASRELETKEDSVSYAYGVAIAQSLQQANVEDLDNELVAQAVKESLDGNAKIEKEASGTIIRDAQQAAAEKRQAELDEMTAKKVEEFKAMENVEITESGLMIRTIEEGTGVSPAATDTVTVHYTGKLMNGDVFDSSVERGEPATFPLNRVIPGWTEGLQKMKAGGKAELLIPSELAYGPRGAGNAIPPNSTLIFEVELISVK